VICYFVYYNKYDLAMMEVSTYENNFENDQIFYYYVASNFMGVVFMPSCFVIEIAIYIKNKKDI